MSVTDELRSELTKRGVEWKAPSSYDGSNRYDTVAGGYWFHEFDGKITIHGLTPAQAIAATLGEYMTDTEKAALERRIDELCAEVERLHADQAHWELGNCPNCPNVVKWAYIDSTCDLQEQFADRMRSLGIEVPA